MYMNKQEEQEPNNNQSVIDDLNVTEAHAAEVKGGPRAGGGGGDGYVVWDIVDS